MPIKHLETHLAQQKHIQTLPLSVLSETRLGIDASHYLQTLLDTPPSREPLLAATGGLPLALTQRIEDDLRVLEKLHIKPVFVFPGIQPKRWKPHPHLESAEACRDRGHAWAKYEAGQEDAATKLFEGRSCFAQWDLWRTVLRIFRHRNVEFIVAPYLAWSQLIYLQRHNKSYIHAIYGPTDALLYPGVDKVITHLDLAASTPTFQYVSKRNVLQELGVNEDQFLDICILVGFDHCPPFPPTIHEQALKATVDMVKYYKTGHAAVSASSEHPAVKSMGYLDQFARTRSMVKYSLILSSEGTVMPLPVALPSPPSHGHGHHNHHPTAAEIPSDLHEIFTNRLPDEIFFYLSRGLIGPQALAWLTSGQIMENPPLDNGETNEYKRFVKEVITDGQTGPRATALALISSVSHNFWTNRKVQELFWFDQPGPGPKFIGHNSQQTTQLVDRVAGWNVPYAIIEEELRRQNSSTIDFALALGATSTDRLAARTKIKANNAVPLEKKDEVVANVIWRFLELRGFLLNTHTHSSLARAMHSALQYARVNDKFQDPLYIFLELVRAGVMHGHLWSGRAFSGGPSFGTDDEKSSMLLVMRVLSIVPLNFKAQAWSAPLSRELLVFNSFVRSLSRNLRTLLEVTSLNMLLRNDARRARDDFLDIALSLPFQTEVNTGFGVLAKVYLDALTHINNRQRVTDPNAEGVQEAKQLALEICEETFTGVKNPKAEVERGFRFWDVALAAMRQLQNERSVLPEVIEQFEAAEAWLAPMHCGKPDEYLRLMSERMCAQSEEYKMPQAWARGQWNALSPSQPLTPSSLSAVAMPAALVASPNSSLSDLQILDLKPFVPAQHFYVRQPHCLQIIQLEEADALPQPPPRKAISSSSFASSSYYSSSYYSESEAYSEDDEEDEDEEMCSSYCSSDDAEEESQNNVPGSIQSPETYSLRMKRILAWREHFDAASSLLVPETAAAAPSKSLKRKLDEDDASVTDNASHSSKRSRSSQYSATGSVEFDLKFLGISSPATSFSSLPPSTTSSPSPSTPTRAIGMHSCTACDAFFDSAESLREHGLQARVKELEACAVAVEYAFE